MYTNKTMSMSHRLKMQPAEREIEKKQKIWAVGTGGTEGTIAHQVLTGIEAKPLPSKDFGITICPPGILEFPTALKKNLTVKQLLHQFLLCAQSRKRKSRKKRPKCNSEQHKSTAGQNLF